LDFGFAVIDDQNMENSQENFVDMLIKNIDIYISVHNTFLK
jgi:hypothetical protein